MDEGFVGLVLLITLGAVVGPPLLFFIIGMSARKRNRNTANVMFIIAAIWLIVAGGTCASILGGI